MKLVHHDEALVRAAAAQLDVRVGAQRRDVVGRDLLDQVDLAVLQRCG